MTNETEQAVGVTILVSLVVLAASIAITGVLCRSRGRAAGIRDMKEKAISYSVGQYNHESGEFEWLPRTPDEVEFSKRFHEARVKWEAEEIDRQFESTITASNQ